MHFFSKRAVVLGIVATLGFAGTAQAETDTTQVTLTGGAITLAPQPAFGDFPGATLDGSAGSQSATAATWGVDDRTGSGRGYDVAMAATDPSTAGDAIVMNDAVLSVVAPVATAVDASNTSGTPETFGGAITDATLVVADAAADEGMGDWNYAQGAANLTLATPADAKAGLYTSTITTTLTQGVL